MKNRLRQDHGQKLKSHELLEMALYYVMPRKNTNELAHVLIKKFGSLRNVIFAEPHMIESISGFGKETSTFLMLIAEIKKRIDLDRYDLDSFNADTLSAVGDFLINYYKDRQREEICAMLLDNSFKLIEFLPVSLGSVDCANFDTIAFTRYVASTNAKQVILAHNHPSGSTAPSTEDSKLSMRLNHSLDAIGVRFVEHIIVNDVSYTPTLYISAPNAENREKALKLKNFYSN